MSYQVTWSPKAEEELAALWLIPELRAVVTELAERFDARLALNAADVGESREGSIRIAFEQPIAISFTCDAQSRVAIVLSIWRY